MIFLRKTGPLFSKGIHFYNMQILITIKILINHYLRYGQNSFSLAALIESLTSKLNTKYELNRLKIFVSQQTDLGVTKPALDRAIENIQTNIRWMDKNYKLITDWLISHASRDMFEFE